MGTVGPTFDPVVVDVLEAFGRRAAPNSAQAIPAEDVVHGLPSLRHDRPRAREILTQLASGGLLDPVAPGGRETLGTYSLTGLGWARIEQRKRAKQD
jgi:hypothetical protein